MFIIEKKIGFQKKKLIFNVYKKSHMLFQKKMENFADEIIFFATIFMKNKHVKDKSICKDNKNELITEFIGFVTKSPTSNSPF